MEYKQIREIDGSEHIEKKGKFSYLSWAWAVDQLLQIDPKATWEFKEREHFIDGTVMVYCTVTLGDISRTAFLPVMDHKNNAVQNPDARKINDAMQRCLVKAISLHGLGLYIYAGEDLPDVDRYEFTIDDKKLQRDFYYGLSQCKTINAVESYMESWKDDFDNMHDLVKGQLTDTVENKKAAIEKGIEQVPQKYGFVNVTEAAEFAKHAKQTIDEMQDLRELSAWMSDNDDKLKALDDTLSAAKYQTEEGTPYQRIVKLYNEKISEKQLQAAE